MEEKNVDSAVSSSISGAVPTETTKREERSNSSNRKSTAAGDSSASLAAAIAKYEAERGTFGGGVALGMFLCLLFMGMIAFGLYIWKRQKNTNGSSSSSSTNSKRADDAKNLEMVGVTIHEPNTLNNPAFGQRRLSAGGETKITEDDKKKPHRRASTKLPKDWKKHSDGTGKRYYANKVTKESSWTAPPGSTGGTSSEIEMMVNPISNAKKQRRLSSRELIQAEKEKEKETEVEEEQYTCEHCDTFTGNFDVVGSHEAVCDSNPDAVTMETEASDENIEIHLDEETGRRYSINNTTGESEWLEE
jgi:hypothetical protein